MAKTLLEQLRGGSSLLNQMRGIEDTPGNRELMQSLQEPIPAPEHKPHVPGNALEAGLVAAGAGSTRSTWVCAVCSVTWRRNGRSTRA